MLPSSSRGFYDPHSEMNRLFDEMLGGLSSRRSGGQQRAQGTAEWALAIDVVHKDDDLVVRAELPGTEDVDVTVHQEGALTINGKREEQTEEERGGYLVKERRSGSFRRSIHLPEGVDEDSIRARFENGVLEISIEGAAAVQGPKRIEVESGQGAAEGR